MSIWGAGPFEDDDSVDFYMDLIDDCSGTISAELNSDLVSIDNLYLVHSVAKTLVVLCSHIGDGGLTNNIILAWQAKVKAVEEKARAKGRYNEMDKILVSKLWKVLNKLVSLLQNRASQTRPVPATGEKSENRKTG